ncbi:uncharacterized protein LOC143256971 [Tachypleus tridentatus]|uniref:uncharacterized protein LOC143256971 n=1 Tax=Tachypleus tridentatus TaxID=6853 RepID=UPI003FD25093
MQDSDFCRRVTKRKLCHWFEDSESPILEDVEPQFKRKAVFPKRIETAVRGSNKHVAIHGWESCNSGFDQVNFSDVENIKDNRLLQRSFTSRNKNKSLQEQQRFPMLRHDLPSQNVRPIHETQVLDKYGDSKIILNTDLFLESQSVCSLDEKDDDHNISLVSYTQPKSFEKYIVAQEWKSIYQDSSEISSISGMCLQGPDTNKCRSRSCADVLSLNIPEVRFKKPTSMNSLQKTPVKSISVISSQTKPVRPISDDCSESIPVLSFCESVLQTNTMKDKCTCYYQNNLGNLVPLHDAQAIPINSTCVNHCKRNEDCTELSIPTSSLNVNRKLIYCVDKNKAGFEELKPYTCVSYFENSTNRGGSDSFHLSNFHCDSIKELIAKFVNKDNSVMLYVPSLFNCSLSFLTRKLPDKLTKTVQFNEFSKSLVTSPQRNVPKKPISNFTEKEHLSLISVSSIPSAKKEIFQQKVINTVEEDEFSDTSSVSQNVTGAEIVYSTEELDCLSHSSDGSQHEVVIDQFESQCISSLDIKEGNEVNDSPSVHSFDSEEEFISSPLSQHITSPLSQSSSGVISLPRGSDWLQHVSWQQKTPEKNNDQTFPYPPESGRRKKKKLSGGFANKLNKLEAREKSYEAIWWHQMLLSLESVESEKKLMLRQTNIRGKQMVLELKLETFHSKGGLIWAHCTVVSNTSVTSQNAALRTRKLLMFFLLFLNTYFSFLSH